MTRELLKRNKSSDQETWEEIIKYLENELKIKEMILLFEKSNISSHYKESRKTLTDGKSNNVKAIQAEGDQEKIMFTKSKELLAKKNDSHKTVLTGLYKSQPQ